MKKETIVVASSNKGKISEIKEIFKDYDVLSIKDMENILGKKITVNENNDTYKDNALEKVRDLYEQIGKKYICIADDSGISIDILNSFPGVHTARWLDADDHIKNLELLKKVKREGINELIEFIEKTDFFTAPASTRFHGSFEGGLLEHSMKVYEILKHKVKNSVLDLNVSDDTLIIIALLHDICKVNFYKVDYRNAKNERGEWEKVPYYTVDDTIPYGHGEKSVMMITEYMKLTVEEKYCIRWHMGFTEPKEAYNTLGQAFKKFPLALILHEADLEATYFYNI